MQSCFCVRYEYLTTSVGAKYTSVNWHLKPFRIDKAIIVDVFMHLFRQ